MDRPDLKIKTDRSEMNTVSVEYESQLTVASAGQYHGLEPRNWLTDP